MSKLETVRAFRHAIWEHGYPPVQIWSPGAENSKGEPIKGAGKRPVGLDWREKALADPPAAITGSVSSQALNTGILTDKTPAIDIDVLDQELVDRLVHLIECKLGPTPLVRIGRAPKTLLVYHADHPFKKMETPEFLLPDGSKAQVEVLAQGQQFVADGIHPDTGQPYVWTDRSPAEVSVDELPIVTEAILREVIAEAEAMLRAAGAVEKKVDVIPPPPPKHRPKGGVNGSDFFRNVNSAALNDIAAWAEELLPRGHYSPNGAYRVSSAALGRNLEEDLSIHPDGIYDFGLEKSCTAIDLVIDYGDAADPTEAAKWLCRRLGVTPESLGWAAPPPPPPPSPPGPEGVNLDDFYAYMLQHKYIYAPSRDLWPPESINGRLPKVMVDKNKDGDPIYISASRWLDQNRPVEQMTWAPGLPMIIANRLISEGGWITRQNVSCFNLYLPSTLRPGDPTQATPWLDHIRLVYPDDAEHIVYWFAHRVQRPHEKINHAIILSGAPGIGKDTLLEPVKRAVGPWNFREASPAQVMSRFNGFLKGVILRISEIKDLGETDRYKFYEHMKAYTAAPPDVLRCDEKNLHEHAVLNVCGVIYTTNHKAEGLYLPADDRRHYVAWSTFRKEDFTQQYWDQLWSYYDGGGDRHVAAYLAGLDLAAFNPKAPPPLTNAFWDIVTAHRAPENAELADVLDRLGRPDAVTLRMITNNAPGDFAEWLKDRRNRPKIPHRFEDCGYTPVRNPGADDGLWRIQGRREVVYGPASLAPKARLAAVEALQ